MTFSVIGYDPHNGDLGIVVSTARLAVGSRVPYVEAGVGAVATQSITNARLGPLILDLLKRGRTPDDALAEAIATDPGRDERQVVVLNTRGRAAAWTGEQCKEWRGHVIDEHVAAAGNIIVDESVLTESLRAFRETDGELRDRLLAAYRAGQEAGGDRTGVQSAGLRIARINTFPYLDLRVDDHPSPVDELHRLARLAEDLVPRLPRLTLGAPDRAQPGETVELTVTDGTAPVPGIAITANGEPVGETGADGTLRAAFAGPGKYYLAAAEPPTPTRAPASYRFSPAVRWIRVGD